jgi:hypothetical protein
MTHQDEYIRGSVEIAVLGNLRRQTTHAIRRLRAWRRRRAGRIALGGIKRVARGEIRELKRLLIRSGVSCEEVSQAMPALLHCLVKRQRVMATYAVRSGYGLFVLFALQIAYVNYFQISNVRLEHINDATFIAMLLIGAMIFMSPTRVRHFERALRYDPKLSERMALKYFWVVSAIIKYIWHNIVADVYYIAKYSLARLAGRTCTGHYTSIVYLADAAGDDTGVIVARSRARIGPSPCRRFRNSRGRRSCTLAKHFSPRQSRTIHQ